MLIAFDCRIIRDKNPAGIARVVLEFLKNVLVYDRKNDYILIFDNIEMKELVMSHLKNVKKRHKIIILPYGLMSFSDILHLPKILRERKIDIYYVPYYITSPFHKGYKVIITIFDLIHFFYPRLKMSLGRKAFHFFSFMPRLVFKRADRIITISISTSRDLVKKFRISPKKVRLIYMGVAESFHMIDQKKSKRFIEDKYKIKKPYILYVGRNEPHKNIKAIVLAYRLLPKNIISEYNLVFVGKQEERYEESIKELIEKYNLSNNIIFTGYVEESDLSYIYSAASVFVFPSFYEGFGLPILEAMKCGVPVVSSNTSSLPEVGGDAVLYAEPYDVAKISDHIKNILENRELKNGMIKKGLDQVKKFTWFKAANNLLQCFKEFEK